MNERGREVLLLLVWGDLLINYVETMVVPAIPTIQNDFSISSTLASWITSAFIIVGAIVSPIFGKLADTYGRKKMYLVSLGGYLLAVGIAGFSPTIYTLIGARAIQGIGYGIFPVGLAIITDVLPPDEVATAQGLLSGSVGIGTALGLIIGSYIDQDFGWQYAFHTAFILSLVFFLVILVGLKDTGIRTKQSIDYVGTSLLTLGMALILVYITEGPSMGWLSSENLTFLVLGTLLIFAFIPVEMRVKEPLVDMKLMKIRNIMVANLVGIVSSIALMIMYFGIIYYAQLPPPFGLGLDILSAGLTLAPATVVMFIVGPIVGKLTGDIGPKPLLISGSIISILGFSLLIVNRESAEALVEDVIVAGTGMISIIIPLINMIAVTVPERDRGIGLGMNTLLRNLGASIGPVLSTSIMSSYKDPYVLMLGNNILDVSFFPGNQAFNIMFQVAILVILANLGISLFTQNYKSVKQG
ncbi:MFS transporter [Metallosphaera hakonensis]|uniref:MFS transporter n=1 Tax=Metallosphaera hakonensis JCM 8857 = DSM 7519 TaxID=1293036 RepID=A0A2U9IST8_9CREN|nr:MFS transporter [Metallosphaera hakonensis]AWR99098.1 MFS transporter [Metallosphaera hakonensis JCM 8857 = DSM 7519]